MSFTAIVVPNSGIPKPNLLIWSKIQPSAVSYSANLCHQIAQFFLTDSFVTDLGEGTINDPYQDWFLPERLNVQPKFELSSLGSYLYFGM